MEDAMEIDTPAPTGPIQFTDPELDISNPTERIRKEPSAVFPGSYSDVYMGLFKRELVWEQVAIKVIKPVGDLHYMMRRKVKREYRVWAQLKHVNIVPLYGIAEDDREFGPYGALISPWYEFGDAERCFKEFGDQISMPERKKLWGDVVSGVCYLHGRSPPIIHGDLKPSNILIADGVVAKICDFGLVRMLREEGEPTGLTTTSAHYGTIRYSPYEVLTTGSAEQLTEASDVYSMGCVGLFFLFQRVPYAHIGHNNLDDIIGEMEKGIPPAPKPPVFALVEAKLWSILESCWGTIPSTNPSTRSTTPRVLAALRSTAYSSAEQYTIKEHSWYRHNWELPKALVIDFVHEFNHGGPLNCVRFSKGGRYLAIGGNQSAWVVDSETCTKVAQFDNPKGNGRGKVFFVDFSDKEDRIVIGSLDARIRCWDIARNCLVEEFKDENRSIGSTSLMNLSSTGTFLVSGAARRAVRIWDMGTKDCKILGKYKSDVCSVAISSDDKLVLVGTEDGAIYLYEVSNSRLCGRFNHSKAVTSMAFTPDGDRLYSSSSDKTIECWKINPDGITMIPNQYWFDIGDIERTTDGHEDTIRNVSVSPDGKWITSTNTDGTVVFWDREGRPRLLLKGHEKSVISTDFSRTGELFATASEDGKIKIWRYSMV